MCDRIKMAGILIALTVAFMPVSVCATFNTDETVTFDASGGNETTPDVPVQAEGTVVIPEQEQTSPAQNQPASNSSAEDSTVRKKNTVQPETNSPEKKTEADAESHESADDGGNKAAEITTVLPDEDDVNVEMDTEKEELLIEAELETEKTADVLQDETEHGQVPEETETAGSSNLPAEDDTGGKDNTSSFAIKTVFTEILKKFTAVICIICSIGWFFLGTGNIMVYGRRGEGRMFYIGNCRSGKNADTITIKIGYRILNRCQDGSRYVLCLPDGLMRNNRLQTVEINLPDKVITADKAEKIEIPCFHEEEEVDDTDV